MYSLDSHKEMVEAVWRLAYLAEFREGNNLAHLERIRGYTQVLGRGLGLSQNEIQLISVACQLHDIGKVGLPEVLLLQQGQYSDAEMQKIKRHTTIGAEILSNSASPLLQAGEIAGEEIPLSARLCAIADVFDALTTPRPYKKEISPDDAWRLIAGASGTLFDPQLVQVFTDELPSLLKIKKSVEKR